jgi:hypothetical protein
MWASGFLRGKDTAAGLAFAGTLLTGAVSFVGLILKQATDARTADEAANAEDRLRLEAAMQAAQLLSTADAKRADQATTAGAILALARLGQSELAAALLSELWEQERISDGAGVLIVNEALRSGTDQAKADASYTLYMHCGKLAVSFDASHEGYDWPFLVDRRWLRDVPAEVSRVLLKGWVYMWTHSPLSANRWKPYFIAGLCACWQTTGDAVSRFWVLRLLEVVWEREPSLSVEERVENNFVRIDPGAIARAREQTTHRPDVDPTHLIEMMNWVRRWWDRPEGRKGGAVGVEGVALGPPLPEVSKPSSGHPQRGSHRYSSR